MDESNITPMTGHDRQISEIVAKERSGCAISSAGMTIRAE
jgi:hypothetical protein